MYSATNISFQPGTSAIVTDQRFSKWLVEARQASGFTQPELAKLAKTSKQYISTFERALETGAAVPRPSEALVDRLARALNRPIAEARLAAGYAPPAKGEDHEMLEHSDFGILFYEYKTLTEKNKQEVQPLIEFLKTEVRRRKAKPDNVFPRKKS